MDYTYFAAKGRASIRGRLAAVCDVLDRLYQELNAVSVTMAALQAQGATEATLHWRRPAADGKPGILELLHPQDSEYTQQAGRRREYIGTDPDRQQEAMARVKRWEMLQTARGQEKRIRDKMGETEGRIDALEWGALGRQLKFGDTTKFGDKSALLAGIERPQENK